MIAECFGLMDWREANKPPPAFLLRYVGNSKPNFFCTTRVLVRVYSITNVGFSATAFATLKKLGEVAITASWISANWASVPSPLMRTV